MTPTQRAVACGCLLTLAGHAPAEQPKEPELQHYSIDMEAKLLSDRKTRGVSDSFNGPGAEFNLTAAHESGLVGYLELGSVSKTLYPKGRGMVLTTAIGYRGGRPDSFHYGVGAAQEWFPRARVEGAPTGIDWNTGEPTGFEDTKFDTSYGVIEFGYGLLYGRYLYVASKDFRGNNTSVLCGSTYLPEVLAGGDPSKAIACYGDGAQHTRGSHLFDFDLKYPLGGQTKLLAHLGYQKIHHFSGIDGTDYRLGLMHTLNGLDFSAEVVGASLNNRDFARVADSDGHVKRMDRTALVIGMGRRF